MSRSTCILVVALAIFQAVVAGVVEHRETVNLELTKVANPTTDLFNVERATCSTGLFLYGKIIADHNSWYLTYEYNNNRNVVMELTLRLQIPSGYSVVEYVIAMSREVPDVEFCSTPNTVGSSMGEVIAKIPPNTKPKFEFRVGAH